MAALSYQLPYASLSSSPLQFLSIVANQTVVLEKFGLPYAFVDLARNAAVVALVLVASYAPQTPRRKAVCLRSLCPRVAQRGRPLKSSPLTILQNTILYAML
jgi:hypothetical protein